MDIASGLAAAGNALGIAKALRDVEKLYDVASVRSQITDLMESLTDTRLALAEAKETIADAHAEIARLKKTEKDRASLVEGYGGYFFNMNEAGEPIGFPVCPKCNDIDDRIVQLVQNIAVDAAKCPVCSNEYKPVTCYLSHGGTLLEKYQADRRAKSEALNRQMQSVNKRGSWMTR